jgi:ATP-dependent helicase/nuclease subunit B
MESLRPRVFTIPPGCPFLPTLIDGLLGGRVLPGLQDLSDATLYLPTRRAARALSALLAERAGGRALLLPRIVALGEADEAEFDIAGDSAFEDAEVLAPPIAPLERRLILTQLVQAWSKSVAPDLLRHEPGIPFSVPASPADAVSLAGELETLMDAVATEGVPWDDIANAVEAEYSKYFALTLDFLRIAAENWPKILADRGASDPAKRRNALIAAEAKRLLRERPAAPVIAAGSTGSVPATATLLAAVARLPNGAVILPGLDQDLDERSWTLIGTVGAEDTDPLHGHPQAILRRLLGRYLQVERAAVEELGAPPAPALERARVLSQALRPANTTERWADFPVEERTELARRGLAGIAIVEAADERDEALTAAVALRETLAEPGKTAALVTPDRALAARVAAELARWGVLVEDSAGIPLSDTSAGRLARLAAEAAAHNFHPARVLALLTHPQSRLGWSRDGYVRAAAALEIGVLRGPEPAPGIAGLRQALSARLAENPRRAPRARRRLAAEDWQLAGTLLDRLEAAFQDFTPDTRAGTVDLVGLAAAHRQVLDGLRACDEAGPDADGSVEALETLFDDLGVCEPGTVPGTFADYPDFFATLARQKTLNPPARHSHRRVKILGLLEARLLSLDRVVLGGLDEGVWPPRTEADAFLNRPMRTRIGLTPPERRIGQTAHDFVQALGAQDVVITRARKRDGSPTVPSRFLQRLKAFSGDAVWAETIAAGNRLRGYARVLETPEPALALARPAPKPDPALVPHSLSVTEIETLIRDPYSIYARHILKLDPLEGVAGTPNAADRGTIVHAVLARFVETYPHALPPLDEGLRFLQEEGEREFAWIKQLSPRLHAEWWPRFLAVAREYLDWEARRRPDLQDIHVEVSGSLPIALSDGSAFALRARADRIELARDGASTVLDYKTGMPPTPKTVYAGFSPQLTLQAAMLKAGAFKGIAASAEAPELVYVHTSGGRAPFTPKPIKPPRGDAQPVAELVDEHLRRLAGLLSRYASGEAGFMSRPYAQYAQKFSDYDHLARVGEWSASGADAEEGL